MTAADWETDKSCSRFRNLWLVGGRKSAWKSAFLATCKESAQCCLKWVCTGKSLFCLSLLKDLLRLLLAISLFGCWLFFISYGFFFSLKWLSKSGCFVVSHTHVRTEAVTSTGFFWRSLSWDLEKPSRHIPAAGQESPGVKHPEKKD